MPQSVFDPDPDDKQLVTVTLHVAIRDRSEWPSWVFDKVNDDHSDPWKDEVSLLAAYLRKTISSVPGVDLDTASFKMGWTHTCP